MEKIAHLFKKEKRGKRDFKVNKRRSEWGGEKNEMKKKEEKEERKKKWRFRGKK